MVEEKNKPSDADAGDDKLTSSDKTEDVKADKIEADDPAKVAEYYKTLTGRDDIKTQEDFDKHYEGLKSLVGDQATAQMREKAEKYDELQKKLKAEAEAFAKTEEGQKLEKEVKGKEIEDRVTKIEESNRDLGFLKAHPEAEPVLNLIKNKAKAQDISLEKAYTETPEGEKYSLQELLKSKLEADKAEAEERSISVDSKSRISPGSSQKVQELVKQVEETDSLEAKEKLVGEILDLPKT